MRNYFKWIMLFLYLVAIGAVVNYYTAKYEKGEEVIKDKMDMDSLRVEPIIEDSLPQEDYIKLEKSINEQ